MHFHFLRNRKGTSQLRYALKHPHLWGSSPSCSPFLSPSFLFWPLHHPPVSSFMHTDNMPLSLWPCIPSLHYHLRTKDLNTTGEREQEKGKDRADKKSTEMSADSWKRGGKETSGVNEKNERHKVRCQQCVVYHLKVTAALILILFLWHTEPSSL